MDFDSFNKVEKDVAASKAMEEIADKFTKVIPDLQVTPAELQNFFIMTLMEQEELEDEEQRNDIAYVMQKVPEFLKSVRRDREQALDYNAGVDFTIKTITESMARSDEKLEKDEETKSEKDGESKSEKDEESKSEKDGESSSEEDTHTVVEEAVSKQIEAVPEKSKTSIIV
jgi:hypothetical protein